MGEIADALKRAGKENRSREDDNGTAVTELDSMGTARVSNGSQGPPRDVEAPLASPSISSSPPEAAGSLASSSLAPRSRPVANRISLLNPELLPGNPAARISLEQPSSPDGQAYRRIAFRVRDAAHQRHARAIVIVSAEPSEGKTTTACNLAAQLARLDHSARTLLVDLDFHRAALARALGIRVPFGSAEVIRGNLSLEEAIQETDFPSLSVLGLPGPISDVDEILANPATPRLIRELANRFDHVIIDSPPVLAASDAQILLRSADAALMVARASQSKALSLTRALEELPADKILGTLLNGAKRRSAKNYGYGYSAQNASSSTEEDQTGDSASSPTEHDSDSEAETQR